MRQTHPGHWLFAIPNGGGRSKGQGGRMKAEGVSAGVPDLYIPSLRLWIEMKRTEGGSVAADQKKWHEYLRGIGDHVEVCRGRDEAVAVVTDVLAARARQERADLGVELS